MKWVIDIISGEKEVVRGFTLPWLLLGGLSCVIGIIAVIKSIKFVVSLLNVLRA